MSVPIVFLWQRLVNAVVKVLVMREYDMASNIVELERWLAVELGLGDGSL